MRPVLDVRFDHAGITDYLKSMNPAQRQSAFRAVMKKVSRPVVADLSKAWRNARRRRGKVTRQIARAQDARVRYYARRSRARGIPSGAAAVQIGTDYRKGGGAKLWHILERGFTHYGSGAKAFTPNGIRRMEEERTAFVEGTVAMDFTPGRSQKEKWHAARRSWHSSQPEKERAIAWARHNRKTRVEAARSGWSDTYGGALKGVRKVPGRFISMPVAERWRTILLRDVRRELFAELQAHARNVAMRRERSITRRHQRAVAAAQARGKPPPPHPAYVEAMRRYGGTGR